MDHKVTIIMGGKADLPVLQEAIKVLDEYKIAHNTYFIKAEELNEHLPALSKELYNDGTRLVIAGTRGDSNYQNKVASHFSIPVIGVPCRSETKPNTVESVFTALQQPNEHAVANVALDAGQNAGIIAVQILALHDTKLQKQVIEFKENLKNKILKADKEMAAIKFDYRTNQS